MRTYLNGILYSFPVQLLLLHIKRNHFLLLFWVILICFITGNLGSRYGITLLFLDPEYYSKVGFFSFLILGFAFGFFFVVWNLTSYILNAQYFSFLATLKRPFGVYCLNNIILPLLFFLTLIYYIVGFQAAEGLLDFGSISYRLGGFIGGMGFVILLAMLYFFRTNKDILQVVNGKENENEKKIDPDELTLEETGIHMDIPVEYYINHSFRVKLTRSADHYPISLIRSVYKQHHANALFIELSSLVLIIMFSLLIDYPFFRIPAAASILLLCTILLMLLGAFTYWLGQWKIFFFIVLIIAVNLLMQSNLLQYHNKAYGLRYDKKAPYDYTSIPAYAGEKNVEADRNATLEILNTWKNKFPVRRGAEKPKIVFINVSGGGLRASMFVMNVLQQADSITQHKLMQHCPLITGASGGMLAAAYYRELYQMKMNGENINTADVEYTRNISKDMLNAVGFTLVVNDMFYPWQKVTYNETTFRKDRGYMFEKILNENTGHVMDKPLSAYRESERKMDIPMMIFYPSILNDERKLFMGAQNFSYLSVASKRLDHFSKPEIDGVDFHYLCANNDPDSILFTSVLRMNCTFPYILPNVHLPTEPDIEVMDAGVRDNYGVQVSARFIEEFSEWIKTNTSGVIVVNIRGIEQQMKIKENVTQGVMEKFLSPMSTLYTNWVEIQDYQNDNILNSLDIILEGNLEVITFEYVPVENSKRASLSLHLTAREKRDIITACNNTANSEAFRKLEQLLK
ncbi:MAG: patatin-like phospholipase family protein [Chitinophagales bacterium]|nr:patatin-like phospholipase family protein [Chitinophagales bacterium]